MIKKMLVNATHPEENRVAIVEDGILSELDIEIAGKEQTKGNIYKATVIRVEQGLQAAFVDYGAERLGFLQMGEIHPGLFPTKDEENKGRPRINDILRRGQELLVQVTKEERGNKGAALTTYLSLPGRYMVLMPGDNTRGMSRKIPDGAERKQLKESIQQFELPDEMGYIIRTAAIGQSPDELKRDLQYLLRVYNNILELSRKIKEPTLVYRESNLMIRSIRDYFTPDMDEVLVDDPAVYQEARDFFQQVMPEYVKLVKLHQERRPIFSKYQIEDQIDTIAHNQVSLPSGGSIVIDTTEALVAIDVNSGKMASEQGVEGTAYKTNLEAATEVARQLRLRDLGGLIVIDFIDMRDRKHIREVEKRLKDALKPDKARVTVGRISQFGLLEMSRQRIKAALAEAAYLPCPNCHGSGRVRSIEAQAVAFLRKLHAAVARGQLERIEGEVPLAVSHYLLNNKREELVDLERRHKTSIIIRGRKSFVADQTELEIFKREKDDKKPLELTAPVTAADTLAERRDEPLPVVNGEIETTEEKPKKSRRRRNRKEKESPPVETTGDTVATETSDSEPTATDGEVPVSEPAADTIEVTAAESNNGETPTKSRRRRRGRRGKKPAAESPVTTEDASAAQADGGVMPEETPATVTTADADSPAVVAAATPSETVEAADAKPARKRRSRRKKSVPTTEASPAGEPTKPEAEPTPPAPEPAPEPAAPAAASSASGPEATVAVAEAPAKKRSSRSRKRSSSTAATTADQPAGEVTAEIAAAALAAATEEQPKAPARRRSKPTTKAAAAEPATETTATAVESTVETAAATTVEPAKPKRRTTRSKKTIEESGKTAEPAATAEQPEDKPKRTRKPKTVAAKEAGQPEAGTEAPAKPKRSSRKKPAAPKDEPTTTE